MTSTKPMSSKIIRVFLFGALLLHVFYGAVLFQTTYYTDNKNSERRLALVAPHHFKVFSDGFVGEFTIDPMLKIYSEFELLPENVKSEIDKEWQGIKTFHFENDIEYLLYAERVPTKTGMELAYALSSIDAVEWHDNELLIFQLVLGFIAIGLFALAAWFIVKMARQISQPFSELANELMNENSKDYQALHCKGEASKELDLLLASINEYRHSVYQALKREKAFTRYVSHELRTPMTVIKGCLSILRKVQHEKVQTQSMRIDKAIVDMERLTHTFLLLARDEPQQVSELLVSQAFVLEVVNRFTNSIEANQVDFSWQLNDEFSLSAEPILIIALISNLLKNAINCSVEGKVKLVASSHYIQVIDSGVGLNQKPRGYEGFGIGLNIVRDICDKYQWQFSLENNVNQGCTATVKF